MLTVFFYSRFLLQIICPHVSQGINHNNIPLNGQRPQQRRIPSHSIPITWIKLSPRTAEHQMILNLRAPVSREPRYEGSGNIVNHRPVSTRPLAAILINLIRRHVFTTADDGE